MFRRLEDTLDPDPRYPADLKKLGYFIDSTSHACIRDIRAPDQFFDFFHTNNDRHNQVRGEAMRTCQRQEVLKRLAALGIQQLYLPALTYTKPRGPHVPILAPPAEILKTRKRVIIVINDDCFQDLGILAYRQLQRELGLNGGSVVNFAKELVVHADVDPDFCEQLFKDGAQVSDEEHVPGLIVMNTTQLLYSHKLNEALSIRSWNALPRKSITHDVIVIHPVENRIQGHGSAHEHIKSAFDTVINNPDFVNPNAELYVIGIENGTEKYLEVLNDDFEKYGSRVTALAVIHSSIADFQITNPELKAFLHQRARHWKISHEAQGPEQLIELPLDYKGTPLNSAAPAERKPIRWQEQLPSTSLLNTLADAPHRFASSILSAVSHPDPKPAEHSKNGTKATDTSSLSSAPDGFPDAQPICPTFGGGDTWVGECVFTQPSVQRAVLAFFDAVAQNPTAYRNPDFKLTSVPQPTPDNPLSLSADHDDGDAAVQMVELPAEMLSEEQQALDVAKAQLAHMKASLLVLPADKPGLAEGRQRLETRIAKKEAQVATDAAQELRDQWEKHKRGEKWEPLKTGPSIPFAGVQLDSEMVKAAGLTDTVEEELERLELEDLKRGA